MLIQETKNTVLFNMNNINNNNNKNSDSSSSISDKNEKRKNRSNKRTPQYFYYRLDVILWVLQCLQSASIQYSYTQFVSHFSGCQCHYNMNVNIFIESNNQHDNDKLKTKITVDSGDSAEIK